MKTTYLEQLFTYGKLTRDPRERVVSVTHFALVPSDHLDKAVSGKDHLSLARIGIKWKGKPLRRFARLNFIPVFKKGRPMAHIRNTPFLRHLRLMHPAMSRVNLASGALLGQPADQINGKCPSGQSMTNRI